RYPSSPTRLSSDLQLVDTPGRMAAPAVFGGHSADDRPGVGRVPQLVSIGLGGGFQGGQAVTLTLHRPTEGGEASVELRAQVGRVEIPSTDAPRRDPF